MKTLYKVLSSQHKPITKWISSMGTIVGLVIILLTIQLFQDFNPLINKRINNIDNNYQVISKKIGELSFLSNKIKGFSKEQIDNIKNHENVTDIAPFSSCNYQVMISIGNNNNGIPSFYTLAFFESVPSRFLAKKEGFYNWDSSFNEVPVILPKNYLDAYNYGLALSMNTPQISESFLKKLRFKIEVSGNKKKGSYVGKIAGLSKNLNSIIVPEQFLNLTNLKYGKKEQQDPSRVIIKTLKADDKSFIDFLNEKNYSLSDNSQQMSLIQQIIIGLFSYQFIIAVIIITQGLLLLLFYTQIIIKSSKELIKKLFILGYHPKEISIAFEKILLKTYLLIFSISIVITLILKFIIAKEINEKLSVKVENHLSYSTVLIWIIVIITFFVTNRLNLKRRLKSISDKIYI